MQFERVRELLERDFDPEETMRVLTGSLVTWFSWGASRTTAIRGQGYHEGKVVDREVGYRGVIFHVNGRKFKGWVLVTLDWTDVYTIHLLDEGLLVPETIRGVYVDVLVDVIDGEVETD